jgi:hypothetical protein
MGRLKRILFFKNQRKIIMGQLKPGATYIYERVNGTVYAREHGTLARKEIGWDYDPRTSDGRPLHDHMMDDKMWGDIRRTAKTNKSLQKALDRAILIYNTIKDK